MPSQKKKRDCSFTAATVEGITTLHLAGHLNVTNASSLIEEFSTLFAGKSLTALHVDLKNLTFLDDYGVAVLVGLRKLLKKNRDNFLLQNTSTEIRKVLDINSFATLGTDTHFFQHPKKPNAISRLGEATIEDISDLSNMTSFLGSTCLSLLSFFKNPRSLRWNDTLVCMQKTGVDALPIVGLISFLLGLIMAFMSSVQLQQFGANIYVASLVSLSMTRELGPIMTCIIVAGRSSSAFAAEIGSMKISEEIDALFTMGFDPHYFLVTPKIIASFLVVPLLVLFSDIFAITGGLIVGVGMLDLTINGYVTQTIKTLTLFDVFWGFMKGGIFALFISWIGCLRGFQVKGGAAGVGQATTSAVVSSIFMIILADSILAVILRYWE